MSNLQSSADKAQMIELLNSIKMPIMGAGGGFAPIGTINFFDASIAPQGWLVCDGSTYNIADYPELATFYASVHGSANFYGGDGTTTFAVPDLRGEFLRGSGTNSHTNQGSGASVGEHQDGTEIQNVNYNNSNNNPEWNAAFPSGAYTEINPDYHNKSTNITRGVVRPSQTYVESSNYQYSYTTRPTNTSFLICVKATDSDAHLDSYKIYSPNEHQVGLWQEEVDGVLKQKPLYEKTITCGTMPNNTTKEVDIGVSNLDRIFSIEGEALHKTSHTSNPLPYSHVSDLKWQVQLYYLGDNEKLQIVVRDNWTDFDAYVTIQYTKTTDQWQVV